MGDFDREACGGGMDGVLSVGSGCSLPSTI